MAKRGIHKDFRAAGAMYMYLTTKFDPSTSYIIAFEQLTIHIFIYSYIIQVIYFN